MNGKKPIFEKSIDLLMCRVCGMSSEDSEVVNSYYQDEGRKP